MKESILIVSTEFPPLPGGIGNHAYNLAREFSKKHKRVIVITEERANSVMEWNDFCDSADFEIIGIKRNRFIFYTYVKRVFIFLYFSIKYKPVTFFSGKFSIWLASINPSRNKSFAIIHGSEIKCKGIWKRVFQKGLNSVKKIISVSNYTQNILLENYELDPKQCIVINNGFNFENSESNASLKESGSHLEFITVGGMHQRKGQHNFINALPEIILRFGNVKYHVAGIPQELDRLQKLAISLDVLEYIHFYNSPTNNEVLDLLKKSDIFIMLSENLDNGDFEGFGIAILESMSMGLPAIGSKNTGIEDAISNHFSGVLVDHSSVKEISEAVFKIQKNYNEYSENARLWSQKFAWEKVIKQYEVLL